MLKNIQAAHPGTFAEVRDKVLAITGETKLWNSPNRNPKN